MLIGIPKEIKTHEYRVGATPYAVKTLTDAGHEVIIENNSGLAIGYTNEMYKKSKATIVNSAKEVYEAEMIYKVKEPQSSEFPLMHEEQIIFAYLHLAPDPKQTKALLDKKVIGIAFETITDNQGHLPLLVPMSEMAGRISIQAGANALHMANGGRGVLLGGIPGIEPSKVVVVGAGVVGTEAARMALGLGAEVFIFDINLSRLKELDLLFGPNLKTMYSIPPVLEEYLSIADLVIGAVLIPGKQAPKLLTKKMLTKMQKGSVIVDVCIDQGGFAETSKPTTHDKPTFVKEGVIHYCVANMPGACARTSTQGLSNATLPYALKLANLGYKKALLSDPNFMNGVNVYLGKVTNYYVAQDLGYEYADPGTLITFN